MIVLNDEEDDRSARKLREDAAGVAGPSRAPLLGARPSELPLRAEDAEDQLPPAYPGTGYQTFPQPPPRPSAAPRDSLPPPVNSADRKQPQKRTWRRFVRALVVALVLYALLSIVFQGYVGRRETDPWDGGSGWPLPPGGRYESQSCARFQENKTEFALDNPLSASSDGLFFVTHGDQSIGDVHFKYDASLRGNFGSLVEAHDLDADQQKLLAATGICILRTGNTHGIGISTPSKHIGNKPLVFTVTLSLPYAVPRGSKPITLGSIKSSAPNYRHTLEIPRELYFVEEVDLRATNRPITSFDIAGASVSLKTTNAQVTGELSVNQALKIKLTNGRVAANITAKNNPSSDETTSIDLSTTNGPIKSTLLLESAARNGSGGKFKVSAASTNNPVQLETERMPLGATLDLLAKTANSPVEVRLAPEFEGNFDLATTNSPAIVSDEHNRDPTRRGRERKLKVDQASDSRASGAVSWSKDYSTGEGNVVLKATNSPVTLYL